VKSVPWIRGNFLICYRFSTSTPTGPLHTYLSSQGWVRERQMNPKLSPVYRQNISLLPYTLRVPTVKSTDRSNETRKNILSSIFHKIYKRKHLYTPQLPSSINRLFVKIRFHLYISARWGYVVNNKPLLLYRRESDSIHCTGGWVNPRVHLDGHGKSRPTGIRFPDRPAHSLSLTNYPLPAHTVVYKRLHFWGIGCTIITVVICMFHGCQVNASI
jgi:hypothetical protein